MFPFLSESFFIIVWSRRFARARCGKSATVYRDGATRAPGSASASSRFALVFSAEKYETLKPLANPQHVPYAVADAPEKLGFEVTLEDNRDLKRMRRALENCSEDVAGGEVGSTAAACLAQNI